MSPGWVSSGRFVWPLLTLSLVLPPSAWAQNQLAGGSALVDASDPSRVRVELLYRVEVDGTESAVPFEGLVFRPSELASLSVSVDGRVAAAEYELQRTGRWEGHVPLPTDVGGEVEVQVSYVVTGAYDDTGRLRLPILALGWPAPEARPGVFEAEVLMPGDLRVVESFPSGVRALGEAGEFRRWTLDLPAVPSLFSLRTAGEGSRGLSLAGVLDLLVILALGIVTLAGWVHFRRAV